MGVEISASRSTGKSVQGQLILITWPRIVLGIDNDIGQQNAGVEAFYAFNWKYMLKVKVLKKFVEGQVAGRGGEEYIY